MSQGYFCSVETKRIYFKLSTMKFAILTSMALGISMAAHAYTVKGTVTDSETGETLVGAIVSCEEIPNIGTSTGLDGSYSVNIPDGKNVTLVWHYVSYHNYSETVNGEAEVNVALTPEGMTLHEVSVIGRSNRRSDVNARLVEKNVGQHNKHHECQQY